MDNQAIRRYRERAGLTQDALSRKLGVKEVTVWRWENGHRWPEPGMWRELRKAIGIPLEKLLKDNTK